MRIGILGTGAVGQALASKLTELGHDVMVGTRDVEAARTRTEAGMSGGMPFADWLVRHPGMKVGTFAGSAAHGQLVVNATVGHASLEALQLAGAANLEGKTLVDVSNPLDFSKGMPPTLFVSDTDSLGERIQRAFPDARVVKTLNTVNAEVMVDPGRVGGGDHSVFVSGDDLRAKEEVTTLLHAFGWRDILDLGDISTARGPEMYLGLWLRLFGATGDSMLNVKIVR